MMPLYIFEDSRFDGLFPLTYSRSAAELRCGTLTLLQRLQRMLGRPVNGLLVRDGLSAIVHHRLAPLPVNPGLSTKEGLILINARWLALGSTWNDPAPDSAGLSADAIVWAHLSAATAGKIDLSKIHEPRTLEALLPTLQRRSEKAILIHRPWDLLEHNHAAILEDFRRLGRANESKPLVPNSVHILAPENLHLGANVKLYPGVVLDASAGPIIIEADAAIRANAVITGPTAIGPRAVIRTLADIREDNTIGPGCRVGGEVIGSILLGNVNKQHHGFLGQSIVGEWANLGAGTTTSNLKNTYGNVRVPVNGSEEDSGRMFLGAVIGDHAKLAIGTYLSTGTVVGFASHINVPRPPKFVPSFAWLTEKGGIERVDFDKIVALAQTVLLRRGQSFTAADHDLFVRIATDWSLVENYPWPTK